MLHDNRQIKPRTASASRVPLQVLALLIALCGALLVYMSSGWGIGISPDSAEYINGALRLDVLASLFTLPSHWGPGYPVLLALAHPSDASILTSTRVLQCLLFAANLYLATWLLSRISQNRSSILMVLASALFVCSFALYNIHFFAWSEGPFLLLQMLGAGCLLGYWQSSSRHLLLAAGALAGLALLFRYAGVAWIGASGLVLLFTGSDTFARRFRWALVYGVVALAPFALWLLANHFVRDETTNRAFLVHLVSMQDLRGLLMLVASWFGGRQGLGVFAAVAGLAMAVLWLALGRRGNPPPVLQQFAVLSGTYIGVYTAFILFSKSFLDAYIPFDDRIFVPVYAFLFLLLAAAIARLLLHGDRLDKSVAVLALLSLLISNALTLTPAVKANIARGSGYLSEYTASLSRVDEVPMLQDARIYSNAAEYIQLVSALEAEGYPRKFEPTRRLLNPGYPDDMNAMRRVVQARAGYLVHYASFENRTYYPSLAELAGAGFEVLMEGRGVVILGFPAPAGTDANAAEPVAEGAAGEQAVRPEGAE